MGVLAAGSAYARPSAWPPSTWAEIFRHPCLQNPQQASPPTPKNSYAKFGNYKTTFDSTKVALHFTQTNIHSIYQNSPSSPGGATLNNRTFEQIIDEEKKTRNIIEIHLTRNSTEEPQENQPRGLTFDDLENSSLMWSRSTQMIVLALTIILEDSTPNISNWSPMSRQILLSPPPQTCKNILAA